MRFFVVTKLIGSISVDPVIAFGFGKFNRCNSVGAKSDCQPPHSLSFISLPYPLNLRLSPSTSITGTGFVV